MAAIGETNSKSTDGTPHPGGNTPRIEMIDEIANLSKIPEIENYFSKALMDAKEIFKDKIEEFYQLKDNIKSESPKDKPDQMEEEEISELSKAFENSKTYFFELTRVEDPKKESGFKWELGRFKLKANGKVVNIIFDDFIKNVDQYEVTPQRIHDEIVDVPSLDKKFRINFTKSSPTRVVGFVKEAKKVEEKGKEEKSGQKFVVKSNRNMLKLDTSVKKNLEMKKEELVELLQNNPEFMDNMLFSIRIKQAVDRPQ